MRDLGDMIQRVRKKIGDYADTMVADPHIETALQVAADQVWEEMLEHAQAMRVLLRYSASDYAGATSLVADQEEYELPDDCLRLREVELKTADTDRVWTSLPRARPENGDTAYNRSGNTAQFAGGIATARGLAWCDEAAPGHIRIWPALTSVNGEKIRFRYAAKPAWPQNYGNTLNDPDGDGTKEHNLPDRVTEAIEWGAALELATDKIGASLNYEFAYNTYYRVLRSITGAANATRPVREYTPRVQS